jgi:hypothetical protein
MPDMNWDAIGAIGEVVGAAGVVLTLLYLAIQIRLNTKATDKQSLRDATEFLYNSYRPLIEDHDLADINLRGMKDYENLKPTEKERFHYINVMQLQASTTALGLRGEEDNSLPSIVDIFKRRMSNIGYRQWWSVRGKFTVAPDYLEWFEDLYTQANREEGG